MNFGFRGHRLASLVVLAAAGAWIATGQFSAVGSAGAQAATPAAEATAPEQAGESLHTVAAVDPDYFDHARPIEISGVTSPNKKAVLAARSSGIIDEINMQEGMPVAPDTVVLKLEGPDMQAAVKIAEVALEKATHDLDVAQKLYARGQTAEQALINARTANSSAVAQLEQAQAAADRLTLKVPFGGTVDEINVETGEWAPAGTPIATVLSLDPLVVRAEVSEVDFHEVAVGDTADIELADGTKLSGAIRFISKEASGSTRTFPVEVELPNPDSTIPSGMTASVTLYTAPVRSVLVPRSVITLSSEGVLGIRVVDQDGIANFAKVELVDDTTDGLIISGVPEGVKIIVSGQDLVRDGEKVIVAMADRTAKQ